MTRTLGLKIVIIQCHTRVVVFLLLMVKSDMIFAWLILSDY